jgi:hypothetical protein
VHVTRAASAIAQRAVLAFLAALRSGGRGAAAEDSA